MTSPDMLARRYGRSRRSADPAVTRRRLMVSLVVFVVLGVGFAAWAAAGRGRGDVAWTDLGLSQVSDTSVTVSFQLALPPGRTATCTVRAVNEGLVEVGRRDVVLGPSGNGQLRTTVTLRTTQRATGGGVKACVLT